MRLSVILCTHNPRPRFLERVVVALRAQNLPPAEWELIVVDNASDAPLGCELDLAWHPNGRCLREDELGLPTARLRGISEAAGEVLVFVDDDNVLAHDYLKEALRIGERWPFVGTWGGSVSPEFESAPPRWAADQLWRLAVLNVTEDAWSNLRDGFQTKPVGAGMCVRKVVAQRFAEWYHRNTRGWILGRTGQVLAGYDDHSMSLNAIEMGLGNGRSAALRLTHLLPAARLTFAYFVRHAEDDAMSYVLFRAAWGLPVVEPRLPRVGHRMYQLLQRLRGTLSRETIEIRSAQLRGLRRGYELAKGLRTHDERG